MKKNKKQNKKQSKKNQSVNEEQVLKNLQENEEHFDEMLHTIDEPIEEDYKVSSNESEVSSVFDLKKANAELIVSEPIIEETVNQKAEHLQNIMEDVKPLENNKTDEISRKADKKEIHITNQSKEKSKTKEVHINNTDILKKVVVTINNIVDPNNETKKEDQIQNNSNRVKISNINNFLNKNSELIKYTNIQIEQAIQHWMFYHKLSYLEAKAIIQEKIQKHLPLISEVEQEKSKIKVKNIIQNAQIGTSYISNKSKK